MSERVVILGGGLAGLSAAFTLSRAQRDVIVLEKDSLPGGLAKTLEVRGLRFDLGGHRFLTDDPEIHEMALNFLGEEWITVSRKSKILKDGRYFDYPLQPLNAIAGVGLATSLKIAASYCRERLKGGAAGRDEVSLEDCLTGRFGRVLFDLFFKDYSEKVWGIPCNRIDADLAARRIGGLSLSTAVSRALLGSKGGGKDLDTLRTTFLYPSLGIGRIADKLVELIQGRGGTFLPDREIVRLDWEDHALRSVWVSEKGACRESVSCREFEGAQFISSIPLTSLVARMNPQPPQEILTAAWSLRYRDLVIVAVVVNRPRITDLTWVYIPDREVPFGRIHEPANWSSKMTPVGETVVVAEYFCSQGDPVWNEPDERLAQRTIHHLQALKLMEGKDVLGTRVVRIPHAYPVPEVDTHGPYSKVMDYLDRIRNLKIIGRTGRFKYLNMDEVMKEGSKAAQTILSLNSREDSS